MKNLKLSVTLYNKCSNIRNIPITISIKNDDVKSYYVSSDAVLLDGFTSDKIDLIDEDGQRADYLGKFVKYKPKEVLLKPNELFDKSLNLAEAYDIHQKNIS